jgi:hypothetical protein
LECRPLFGLVGEEIPSDSPHDLVPGTSGCHSVLLIDRGASAVHLVVIRPVGTGAEDQQEQEPHNENVCFFYGAGGLYTSE